MPPILFRLSELLGIRSDSGCNSCSAFDDWCTHVACHSEDAELKNRAPLWRATFSRTDSTARRDPTCEFWSTVHRGVAFRRPPDTDCRHLPPGLKASRGLPPAWPGFRPLRVASADREAA